MGPFFLIDTGPAYVLQGGVGTKERYWLILIAFSIAIFLALNTYFTLPQGEVCGLMAPIVAMIIIGYIDCMNH